jgi:frataxin-like iron-binding protein CyaY
MKNGVLGITFYLRSEVVINNQKSYPEPIFK